jgi:uncharacterized cupin superfamily protein
MSRRARAFGILACKGTGTNICRSKAVKQMGRAPAGHASLEEKMATTTEYLSSSVTAGSWEPLVEEGREIGQVHWLRGEAEGLPLSGLWKISPEDGDFPYKAMYGLDTFHVIQGEAELETSSGEKIQLVTGGIYSFPEGFTATWRTRSPFMKFFVVAK